jgi:hypothetical protein
MGGSSEKVEATNWNLFVTRLDAASTSPRAATVRSGALGDLGGASGLAAIPTSGDSCADVWLVFHVATSPLEITGSSKPSLCHIVIHIMW